ncbi:hypothetical protein PS903_03836 [Pseudomonas fluorescens]|nr:hypothetical protein PS903_03836 [Pseudomonas fluorescens]
MSSWDQKSFRPSGKCQPTFSNDRTTVPRPVSIPDYVYEEHPRPQLTKDIGLIFEWDNGERLAPNIPCHLTFGGETHVYGSLDGGKLYCLAPPGKYEAQLLENFEEEERLKEARQALKDALDAIIVHEEAEAAALKKIQDGRSAISNYLHLKYKEGRGFFLSGLGLVKNLKEWTDLVNPFNHLSNALTSAWKANSTDGNSWAESFADHYSEAHTKEFVEALGFDPSQIKPALLAQSYEIACFSYEDGPSKKLLADFFVKYVRVQNPEEVAEFNGAVAFEIVLAALLIAFTGGAGLAARVAGASSTKLIELLRKLGEVLKKLATWLKSARIKSAGRAQGIAGKEILSVVIPRPAPIVPKEISLPTPLNVPGRVQSRINLMIGDKSAGWTHVVKRHFDPKVNASQFTVSQDELRTIIQSKEVVSTPITKLLSSQQGTRYAREITLNNNIGIDKFTGTSTSKMTVLTDKFGNLITATPGEIK